MSPRTLTYWFTFQSPWSYLGHAAAMEVVRRHGLRVDWKPMDLSRIFPESGGLPLAKRHPHRQAYRDIELQRWRERRGLALNLRPAFWPLKSTLGDRAVVALAAKGADPEAFVRSGFAAVWAEDRNMGDEATLAELLGRAGHDAAAVLVEAQAEAIVTAYDANARAALDAGVFGAPTYILDGEPFWGQDRVALLDDALSQGRGPFDGIAPLG